MTERRPSPLSRALACAVALACVVALAGCPGSGAVSDSRDALVAIDCEVANAEVWVDERFIALVGNLRRGIRLSPGEHRIEIRHDGYFSHYAELTLTARQRHTLTVELAEILP